MLAKSGDTANALDHLQKAAASSERAVQEAAQQAISTLQAGQ